jgi:thiol-disulfide isomerase/thioredoxin
MDLSAGARAFVVFVSLAASLLPAQGGNRTDEPSRSAAGWSERYGMELPRPVDAARREALGYPAPREASVILAEIDELAARMKPIAEVDDIWKQRQNEYLAMQRKRISCISELEEAGYAGERLPALLRTKLKDVVAVWPLDGTAATSYDQLRRDIVRCHPETPAAVQARADILMDYVHMVLRARMRVHPGDYEQLAAVELARKGEPEAGMLILEALVGERNKGAAGDKALVKQWKDWLVEKLEPNTLGYRKVMRERSFGAAIRLAGTSLQGADLDTAAWRGDVILIDFWGMWCVPCREAMPHLKQMLDKYGARGLRVAGVLCDHELDKATKWLEQQGFTWPQFVDRTLAPPRTMHPIAERYGIGGFPTLWIIDRKGVLREEVDRDELEQTVLRYLEEGK